MPTAMPVASDGRDFEDKSLGNALLYAAVNIPKHVRAIRGEGKATENEQFGQHHVVGGGLK